MRAAAAVLVIGALVAASPGRAQGGPQAGSGVALCRELLAPLLPLLSSVPVLAETGPGRCVFQGAQVRLGQGSSFSIGSLILQGPSPAAGEAAGPLVQRRIEAHDVVPVIETGNAGLDWLLRLQQVPLDLVADVTEDHIARRLTVNEVSIGGEEVGRVALDGVIEGVGADDPASGLPDLSKAGIRSIHLHADSKRFFVRYVLPALVGAWHGHDPAAAMADARLQMSDGAHELMALTHSAPESLEALLAFVQDLPKPRHVLDLSVVASAGPVTMEDADDAMTSMMGLATVLAPLRVRAAYDQDAH